MTAAWTAAAKSSPNAAGRQLSFDLRVLRLSRNFGKELAATAALMSAEADAVVLMDADLQHPIALIDEFLKGWLNEGSTSSMAIKTAIGRRPGG